MQQARDDREQKGRGLAAAGLGRGDDVVTGKNQRNCAPLDGRWFGIAGRPHAPHDGLGQAECSK